LYEKKLCYSLLWWEYGENPRKFFQTEEWIYADIDNIINKVMEINGFTYIERYNEKIHA